MLSPDFTLFPEIETERLWLKKMKATDAAALFELRASKTVMQFINRPLADTTDDALALINVVSDMLEKHEAITWGIFAKSHPSLIGTIGFWRIEKENYRAEIGYLLHPSWQGLGMMTEALHAVLLFGFQQLQLHSVEAVVNPANTASIRLLEKVGFKKEAHFREKYFCKGKFLDSAVYSLLATEF